jgi:hypothetical protein
MNETSESPVLNPWWGIWVQPRQAIRSIIDTDPRMHFWVLVLFYGVIRTVSWGIQVGLGDYFPPAGVAGFIVLVGPLAGIISIYLIGSLIGSLGRAMGGKAEGEQIRAVLAWATLPMNVLFILAMFPFMMMLGQRIFSLQDPMTQRILYGSGSSAGLLSGGLSMWKTMLDLIGAIYYIVITVVGISEVEEFGLWKAAGVFSIVVGGLLLVSLLLALISIMI